MIKKLVVLIGVILCVTVSGCTKKAEETMKIEEIEVADNSIEPDTVEEEQQSIKEEDVSEPEEGVDVDLTALSSTMVYSEVYNIMMNPDAYIGKTIKVEGKYYAALYEQTNKYYHYCVISDALACCQQGIEFVLSGDHTYPDDYPEDNAEIVFKGVLGSYEELGQKYWCVYTDEVTVVEEEKE